MPDKFMKYAHLKDNLLKYKRYPIARLEGRGDYSAELNRRFDDKLGPLFVIRVFNAIGEEVYELKTDPDFDYNWREDLNDAWLKNVLNRAIDLAAAWDEHIFDEKMEDTNNG